MGRPRDPDADTRIQQAAIAVFYDSGWSGYSFEAVANRAGVGKSTIYLRYSSKEDLLIDALQERTRHITSVDTGSLRGDLIEMTAQQLENYTSPYGLVTLRLLVESTQHPVLAQRSQLRIQAHLRERSEILSRAVNRGELPTDAPGELILECIAGAVLNMVISRSESERAGLRRQARKRAADIVDFVLGRVG